jgi:hypothetical protein
VRAAEVKPKIAIRAHRRARSPGVDTPGAVFNAYIRDYAGKLDVEPRARPWPAIELDRREARSFQVGSVSKLSLRVHREYAHRRSSHGRQSDDDASVHGKVF